MPVYVYSHLFQSMRLTLTFGANADRDMPASVDMHGSGMLEMKQDTPYNSVALDRSSVGVSKLLETLA
jgi:hypothetical protein